MKLQDYKKLITADFVNNTRRGFADWRDCGGLCTDVIESLEIAKEGLCAENRYADLLDLCNWTYVKWSNTDKDDSKEDGNKGIFFISGFALFSNLFLPLPQQLSVSLSSLLLVDVSQFLRPHLLSKYTIPE